jgi:hypothetical protein
MFVDTVGRLYLERRVFSLEMVHRVLYCNFHTSYRLLLLHVISLQMDTVPYFIEPSFRHMNRKNNLRNASQMNAVHHSIVLSCSTINNLSIGSCMLVNREIISRMVTHLSFLTGKGW